MNLVFAGLVVLIAVFIVIFYGKIPAKDWPLRLALMLQLGGALGNLIDRLRLGHVTDFVSVGNFAVFNVADSCITIGVIIMIVGFWILERNEKKLKDAAEKNMEPENLKE